MISPVSDDLFRLACILSKMQGRNTRVKIEFVLSGEAHSRHRSAVSWFFSGKRVSGKTFSLSFLCELLISFFVDCSVCQLPLLVLIFSIEVNLDINQCSSSRHNRLFYLGKIFLPASISGISDTGTSKVEQSSRKTFHNTGPSMLPWGTPVLM